MSGALAFPVFPDISLPSFRSTFTSNLISKNLSSHQTQPPGTALLADRPWVIYHTFLITKCYPRDNEPFCGVWAGFEATGKLSREYLPQGFHQSSSFSQVYQPAMVWESPEGPCSQGARRVWLLPNSIAGEPGHPLETVLQINSHGLLKLKKIMWSIIHTCSLSPVPLLFNFPTISGLICSHNSRIPQRHYCTAKYTFYPHPQSRGLRLSVETPIPPSSLVSPHQRP